MFKTLLLMVLGFEFCSSQCAAQEFTNPNRSAYLDRVADGMHRAAGGQLDAALSALTDAVSMEGERPEAFTVIASIQRMRGDLRSALETFQRALSFASDSPRERGRALYGIAETLEQLALARAERAAPAVNREALIQARGAWNEVIDFATENSDVINPETARARRGVIDLAIAQDDNYGPVRQRIAQRGVT